MPRSRKTPAADLTNELVAPTRFRCKVGGEWLPLTSFSNAQQKLVQRQRDRNGSVNAANSGMTCRDHSAASRTELRCELCNLIKPVTDFSKNSRQNDENICKRCSAWGETQEPDVTPSPLETGHVSIEETNREVWQREYVDTNDFFDNEMPRAPITELASLGLEDNEVAKAQLFGGGAGQSGSEAMSNLVSNVLPGGGFSDVASQCSRPSEAGTVPSIPPHLKARYEQSSSGPEVSSTNSYATSSQAINKSSSAASVSSRLPPHLRNRVTKDSQAQAEKIPFNAWGPDGNLHEALKSVTVGSTTDTESFAEASQTTASSASASHSAKNKKKTSKRNGGFAKAPRMSRAELQQYDGCTPIGATHLDPAIEQMRRMGYCQSEDSDF